MFKIRFEQLKKPLLSVLVTLVIVAGLSLFFNYLRNRPYLPNEFSQARIEGAKASQAVNQLLNSSLKNLDRIEQLDRQWDFANARLLVKGEINKFEDKRAAAITLTVKMSEMAAKIPQIRPKEARELALEAVSTQVVAASHVSTYNDYLNRLLYVLEDKFYGRGPYDNNQVAELVKKINSEAGEINSLTQKFDELLKKFDAIYL